MKKLSALLLTAVAGGCAAQAALTRQHNPKSEVEAGAVTISASAPMRWEDLVGELRPEFNSATARDYVNTAIAVTQQDFSSRREATSVQAGVDVSGETTQRTQTTETTASGQTTTGREVASQNSAQPLRRTDGGQVVDGTIAAPNNVFTGADRPATWPTQTAGVDPILQYRAAVALHQELVLLDNYLNSAYDPCLQEAWLVRTRLAASPYARNQPIDSYSRIYASYRQGSYGRFRSERIRLVPLLVTDNFERSDTRRYEQLASQVQASLNGVSGVIAAGLGFNRYINNLNAILGSQYNNRLTISQIDDYTLVVRLGAAFSPTSTYEMQSRSYDITFLVVIDRDEITDKSRPIELGFFAETEMRDAESGEILRVIQNSHANDLIEQLDEYVPRQPGYAPAWQRVRAAVSAGDRSLIAVTDVQSLPLPAEQRQEFLTWHATGEGSAYSLLSTLDYGEPSALRSWNIWSKVRAAVDTGIVSDLTLDEVQSRSLGLPDELRSELVRWYLAIYGSTAVMPVGRGRVGLPEDQNGVFRDSLVGGLQARVVGPSGLNPNYFSAELNVASPNGPLTFAASSVSVDPQGVVDAVFPSLGALGINADESQVNLRLVRQCSSVTQNQDARDVAARSYPLLRDRAILASAPVNAVSFQSEAVGNVTAIQPSGDRSTGDARIRLRAIDERNNPYVTGYEIQVRGALLTTAARYGGGSARLDVNEETNAVRVSREFGSYNLSFERLTAGTPVQIKVIGIGPQGGAVPGEEAVITLTVSQPANNRPPGNAPGAAPP